MKRLACVALVLGMSIALFRSPAGAQDSTPTIKEIMGRLHKGFNPPLVLLKKDLQASEPNWEEIQRMSKDFVNLGGTWKKTIRPGETRNPGPGLPAIS